MSGIQMRIMEKTFFDFGNVDKVIASPPETFFATNVDVSGYESGTVLIRVHSKTMPTGTKLSFFAYTSAPTNEDPSSIFRGPALAWGAIDFLAATIPPTLVIAQLPAGFGGTLDFSVRPTFVLAGGPFTASLSADLVLKT